MTTQQNNEWGDIPEGWEVVALGEICDVRDGTHDTPKYINIGIPLVTSKNIINGRLDFSDISYISVDDAMEINKRSKVHSGDIIMSMIGTIGNAILVGNYDDFCIKNVALLKPYHEIVKNNFLIQYIQSDIFKGTLDNSLDGGIQKFISLGNLRDLKIVIPKSTAEQTAIATVLSDTDKLIDSLTALIAKKQAIKSATMNQLLSGQKRLPQFAHHSDGTPKGYLKTEYGIIPENWEVVKVSDIGDVGRGRVISHNEINRSISDLYPVYSSQTTNNGIMGYLDTFDFVGEYVTWTTDGVNAGKVFYRNGKFNCTNVCGTIKVKENYYAEFIALAMGKEARKYVSTNLANPKLMNGVAKSIQMITPKSLTEQTAIAQILSDMDSEITALEHRLAKTKALKQGLMHQLLTGKIRLFLGSLNN